jgi:hypothetical protein
MTPAEIKHHFGEEALDMLYDRILEDPVHVLADWILSFYTEEQIGKWVMALKGEDDETNG